MQRGVKCAGELLDMICSTSGHRYRRLFVTLTYSPHVAWKPSHIKEFLRLVRQRFQRKGEPLRYVWVMELTEAGVPHYHIVFWVRASLRLPTPDRSGLWPHGWSNLQRAHSPIGYLISYAAKGDAMAARFPKGARIFGCGGMDMPLRAEKRWRLLPLYVRVQFNVGDDVRRCRGGGWVSKQSGEWSPAATLVYEDGRITSIPPPAGSSESWH